jgi:hypothetical protein
MDNLRSDLKSPFTNISGNKVQNESPEDIRSRLLHIGAGEHEAWEYTVLADEEVFRQVLECIFSPEEKVAWRAAWIIDSATEGYPELLEPYLLRIIEHFKNTKNSSINRIFTRLLCRYSLPEEYLGMLVDRCFKLLSPLEPVAVRVNSMQLLFNISQQEPELQPELAMVISGLIEEGGSTGLLNKAEKILKKLYSNDPSKRRIKPQK